MARTRTKPKPKPEDNGIEWREPGPKVSGVVGKWEKILEPLLKRPGQWGMIATMSSAVQAQQTASNLQSRAVIVPRPDDDWTFVSRGNEVFAIYRKKAKSAPSVRRTSRKR